MGINPITIGEAKAQKNPKVSRVTIRHAANFYDCVDITACSADQLTLKVMKIHVSWSDRLKLS